MDKKIIIFMVVLSAFLLLTSPVSAKKNVDIKIESAGAFVLIKLVDDQGHKIKSNGKIRYNITDQSGNYKWKSLSYNKLHAIKCDPGKYFVKVKFDGDSKYNSAEAGKTVTVSYTKSSFDPYTYYDNNNWGLNQKMDDYLEYNYWDEEIYDNPYNYDGEGY